MLFFRSKFTEIFVSETTDLDQLLIIARVYLPAMDVNRLTSVLELYKKLRTDFPGKYRYISLPFQKFLINAQSRGFPLMLSNFSNDILTVLVDV